MDPPLSLSRSLFPSWFQISSNSIDLFSFSPRSTRKRSKLPVNRVCVWSEQRPDLVWPLLTLPAIIWTLYYAQFKRLSLSISDSRLKLFILLISDLIGKIWTSKNRHDFVSIWGEPIHILQALQNIFEGWWAVFNISKSVLRRIGSTPADSIETFAQIKPQKKPNRKTNPPKKKENQVILFPFAPCYRLLTSWLHNNILVFSSFSFLKNEETWRKFVSETGNERSNLFDKTKKKEDSTSTTQKKQLSQTKNSQRKIGKFHALKQTTAPLSIRELSTKKQNKKKMNQKTKNKKDK